MECYIHQGEHLPQEVIQEHHVHPRAYGGPDIPNNLVYLCSTCHDLVHRAALRLYSGKAGEAKDMVERFLPNQPARQERLWGLVRIIAKARAEHARSTDVPEAGVEDTAHQSTVKVSLDVPDWLHHRIKTLAIGQGLNRYIMRVLENHALVATQKPGAPPEEMFGARTTTTPQQDPKPTSLKLLNPHK